MFEVGSSVVFKNNALQWGLTTSDVGEVSVVTLNTLEVKFLNGIVVMLPKEFFDPYVEKVVQQEVLVETPILEPVVEIPPVVKTKSVKNKTALVENQPSPVASDETLDVLKDNVESSIPSPDIDPLKTED